MSTKNEYISYIRYLEYMSQYSGVVLSVNERNLSISFNQYSIKISSFVFFVNFCWRDRVCDHSFAIVANFVFLRDVWIRTQRAAVASGSASNLATHLPYLATHLPYLATHLPSFFIRDRIAWQNDISSYMVLAVKRKYEQQRISTVIDITRTPMQRIA
jgi:hypothetical protein